MRTKSLLGAIAAASLLAVGALGAIPANASGGSGGGGSSNSTPPFDFTDAYYTANGVSPAGLVGRRTGSDGLSVISTPPDSNHRNVRNTFTLPAYDTSGNEYFFTVMADLAPNAFTGNSAGANARTLAEKYTVYVFPTKDGNQTAVNNNRQADMIDLSGGYFSNDPLALWIHKFVSWNASAFTTSGGQKALSDLLGKNGAALDGTPIIKSKSDIDNLVSKGYASLLTRPATDTGRYFVCPVIKDPRNGGIASDAFLATVLRPDGTPLPAEQHFVTSFNSLKTTGDWPH